MSFDATTFLTTLLDDVTTVLSARAGAPATVSDATLPSEAHWVATLRVEGPMPGRCQVAVAQSAAGALAALSTGGADASDSLVASTLRDLLTTVILALNARIAPAVVTLVDLVPEPAAPANLVSRAIALAALPAPVVVGALVSFDGLRPAPDARAAKPEPRLDVLLDIDLPVVVRFGRTDMALRALTKLGPGSIVDLGRSPDDPVEVLVSNRVVAHGEVVVVGGNYGVRILDVVSPSERMRSMEG